MHIVLVSECEKKAVAKTRAILDSYAVRAGQRVWITPISAEGLTEIHSALRRSATRQTAVACYRNDGRRRMRLLWIVGSRKKFSADGAVPVRSSRSPRAQPVAVPGWLRCVCLLAQAAGLVHDLGKYSRWFQNKLRNPLFLRDAVRHEWISVCLLRALRRGARWSEAWLALQDRTSIANITERPSGVQFKSCHAPSGPIEAIEFLVASHHKLFADSYESGRGPSHRGLPSVLGSHIQAEELPRDCCEPYTALPEDIWKDFQKLESKLCNVSAAYHGPRHSSFWWACLVLARAALIFADHTVSSRQFPTPLDNGTSAANTRILSRERMLNQPLHWHLQAVAHTAASAAWRMGQWMQGRSGLEGLQEASLAAILEPADEATHFHWQNLAASALADWRQEHPRTPCLVLNMAGTGSGKTRMNLRAVCILSEDAEPRCSIALNLRSLTLQTGHALSAGLGILPGDLATVIGDSVTQELFTWAQAREAAVDEHDPSAEPMLICQGESGPLPAWLERFWRTERERVIVGAPLLVSTVDFLEAAGNPGRQGHHVKALLRLMTADLVLDEIDGYEPEALVAVLRLVQLSAFFGRNVICSSATLSRPVAEALHAAWVSGLELRTALEQDAEKDAISCGIAIIDDCLAPEVFLCGPGETAFSPRYVDRMAAMSTHLRQVPCFRRAFLQAVDPSLQGFQDAALAASLRLHSENAWEFSPGKRLSFGLVRVANINGAVGTARYLAAMLPHAHVACYHSGDWRISRFHKERRLDHLLTRKQGNARILADREIQSLVARSSQSDVLFIVVATPVEEVGRDHDFDWAVIEPSSAQSIVQVVGRVNRHRLEACDSAHNVAILQYNLKHCTNCEKGRPHDPAFVRPGYESAHQAAAYAQHDMARLLPWDEKASLAVNAGLRLDGGSLFAKADDRAVKKRVTRFFGSSPSDDDDGDEEGLFTRMPVDAFRMSATPYKGTPLRDRLGQSRLWQMRLEAQSRHYLRWDSDGTFSRWVRNMSEMEEEAAAPNAWLALAAPQLEALCHEAGISPEEGLQVELTSYNNDSFIYNMGFGIRRKTSDEPHTAEKGVP